MAALALCASAAAQGLVLSVTSPPKTAKPGEFVTHVFSVRNTTEGEITASFRVELPKNWTSLGLPPSVLIPAGAEEVVFLTVAVPRTAPAGEYWLTLWVAWDEEEASAEALVTVEEVAQLEVIAPREEAVSPGESVSYLFEVINRGNVLDRFLVEASSSSGFPLEVTPQELVLVPGERGTVTVTLTVPPDAVPGRDLLALLVRSSVAPAVERRASLFTTVLPPVPELIVGTELAEFAWHFSGEVPLGIGTSPTLTAEAKAKAFRGTLSLSLPTITPPGHIRLSDLSFAFDREDLRLHFGEVSLSFETLRALSGKGIFIAKKPGPWSVSFLRTMDTERRLGGELILRQDGRELGIAGRMEATDSVMVWGNWPWEDLLLHLGTGFGWGSAGAIPAVQAAFTLSQPDSFLEASFFSVGKGFPSSREDQAGFAVSLRQRTETLSLRGVASYYHDNVLGEASPRIDHLDLASHLRITPKEWPLRCEGSASFGSKVEASPEPAIDERSLSLASSLMVDLGNLDPFVRGRWTREEDRVTETLVHALLFAGGLWGTFPWGELGLSIERVGTYSQVGAGHALPVSFVTKSSLLSRTTALHSSFSWERGTQGSSLTVELAWSPLPSLRLEPKLEVSWNPAGETLPRLSIGFAYDFTATFPKIPVRGWLEGRVFIDENQDGLYDPGEKGVEGAVLIADGLRVSTDPGGRFLFPPLDPGTYALWVERLPRGIEPQTVLPMEVSVSISETTQVSIACVALGTISGVVFDDQNQDAVRDPVEPGIGDVEVALWLAGEEIAWTVTDAAGRFAFPLLSPGTYVPKLMVETLPERYEPTTPTSVEVPLAQGEEVAVAFGAWQRPREIIITYQPPIADFTWTPKIPVAEEPVQFDGSGSIDLDGEIVAWEWDLTGDGAVDATGPVVEYIFPAPGIYWVSLVVTDNDGYTGSLVLPVEVGSAD